MAGSSEAAWAWLASRAAAAAGAPAEPTPLLLAAAAPLPPPAELPLLPGSLAAVQPVCEQTPHQLLECQPLRLPQLLRRRPLLPAPPRLLLLRPPLLLARLLLPQLAELLSLPGAQVEQGGGLAAALIAAAQECRS